MVNAKNRQTHEKAVFAVMSRIFGKETIDAAVNSRTEQRKNDAHSDHQKANIEIASVGFSVRSVLALFYNSWTWL